MLISPDLSFSRILPTGVFNKLGKLLEETTQAVEGGSLLMTEAVLDRVPISCEWQMQRFTLVVSQGFSALLFGKVTEMGKGGLLLSEEKLDWTYGFVSSVENGESESVSLFLPCGKLKLRRSSSQRVAFHRNRALNASLTFDLNAIASFLLELRNLFPSNSQTYRDLEYYSQTLLPNNSKLQEKFTLLLLESLIDQSQETSQETIVNQSSLSNFRDCACQQVEESLRKQIAQERLLNRVTTQIRNSLDLSVIMKTAISQVRDFLELDRLVVYKFEDHKFEDYQLKESQVKNQNILISSDRNYSSFPNSSIFGSSQISETRQTDFVESTGCIIYEVRKNETVPSVLNYREKNCFSSTTKFWEKYYQGFILAVNDVEKTYALETCLLKFLQDTQVRAKLVAPIILENKLWGLLIAHQCHATRNWNQSESNLMTAVAEQLAIAIHQAELIQSLAQENKYLEQRVAERTIALHDALEAAKSASRIRNEFLAIINHELKTPLTYVIGMSSTLLRWSFGELTQRQRDYLQTIHDSGEHLLELIDDILDLSQLEAGKAVLDITEFSLQEVAETAIKELQGKANSQKVELSLDLQLHQRRDRFAADVRRVRQILGNLLSNGIKFTPENGSVILRLWWEKGTAVFQVEDTGIGISEEQLPQLFEKFHQLHTPYNRRYEGTGLGLALTKQLVDMHRGRIEVESTVGIGSVFTVSIPLQPISSR
jgi:two-component system, sensor histidine kinase and response regulator